MRFTKKIVGTALLLAALLTMGVTAAAKSAGASYHMHAVDPLNAIIAAVFALLVGGVIYVRRHR